MGKSHTQIDTLGAHHLLKFMNIVDSRLGWFSLDVGVFVLEFSCKHQHVRYRLIRNFAPLLTLLMLTSRPGMGSRSPIWVEKHRELKWAEFQSSRSCQIFELVEASEENSRLIFWQTMPFNVKWIKWYLYHCVVDFRFSTTVTSYRQLRYN